MHLLDTSTFELHEFQGSDIPSYATLSHRWTGQEVSFRDIKDRNGLKMPGFAKIKGCCVEAASEGWQYAWIDSCCIDKSSSAELTEAINSMFQWYKNAEVCYAYLADVQGDGEDPCATESSFRNSNWFKRGWTLQELLAPLTVVFFNCNWIEIGTKSSLYDTIVDITGIKQLATFEKASIAQKMSWASKRETTRSEDMAYCLMGLFNVHMPLLYGEGENSFKRLQLEILNNMDDESLFAWNSESDLGSEMSGLLASSPSAFIDSGDIRTFKYGRERPPFSMTNKGLRIGLDLVPVTDLNDPNCYLRYVNDSDKVYLAPLNAKRENSTACLGIYLRKLDEGVFQRLGFDLVPWSWDMKPMGYEIAHIKQNFNDEPIYFQSKSTFLIKQLALTKSNFVMTHCCTYEDGYNSPMNLLSNSTLKMDTKLDAKLQLEFYYHAAGAIMYSKYDSVRFVLICTVNEHEQAGIELFPAKKNQTLEDISYAFVQQGSYNSEEPLSQPHGRQPLSLDRVTKLVGGGIIVSARLRKMMDQGKKIHVIDITTVET